MLGCASQELFDDRLDILVAQTIAETPVRTAWACRWVRVYKLLVRIEDKQAGSTEVTVQVGPVRVVGDQLHPRRLT